MEAAEAIRRGGLVAFPTETVYGLGADAEDPAAVGRVFRAKGRPAGHPLIVHGADAGILDRYAVAGPEARRLADAFWPGPLTLVVPRTARIPDAVTGGRDTVGLRVPAQPLALRMLGAVGRGVAAPSANPFGRTSPTTAAHVLQDLGDAVDLVLDGGPCAVGVESTILDLTVTPPVLLRRGGISPAQLETVLGGRVVGEATGPARAPGMLEVHYAPRARVRLEDDPGRAADVAAREAAAGARVGLLCAAGPSPTVPAGVRMLQPATAGAAGYATHLYGLLRHADDLGLDLVVAVPPPPGGIADAVRDRLRRAAAASA